MESTCFSVRVFAVNEMEGVGFSGLDGWLSYEDLLAHILYDYGTSCYPARPESAYFFRTSISRFVR